MPDYEQAQSAICPTGNKGRVDGVWFRKRSPTSAGISILTSSVMKHILGNTPELGNFTLDELASKMDSSITTGVGNLCVRVTDIEVIEADNNCRYLAAVTQRHPDILKDREDLIRTLRGLGATSFGPNRFKPHVTLAVFHGNVPHRIVRAVESVAPTSFTVGPAAVEALPIQHTARPDVLQ